MARSGVAIFVLCLCLLLIPAAANAFEACNIYGDTGASSVAAVGATARTAARRAHSRGQTRRQQKQADVDGDSGGTCAGPIEGETKPYNPRKVPCDRLDDMVDEGLASYYTDRDGREHKNLVVVTDIVGNEVVTSIFRKNPRKRGNWRECSYRQVRDKRTPLDNMSPEEIVEVGGYEGIVDRFRDNADIEVYDWIQDGRESDQNFFYAGVEIGYRILPFGNAYLEIGDGNYGEAALSLAGDAAFFTGVGAAANGGKYTVQLVTAANALTIVEAGADGYKAYDAYQDGDGAEALGYFGAATLALLGVDIPNAKQLGKLRKCPGADAADDVPTVRPRHEADPDVDDADDLAGSGSHRDRTESEPHDTPNETGSGGSGSRADDADGGNPTTTAAADAAGDVVDDTFPNHRRDGQEPGTGDEIKLGMHDNLDDVPYGTDYTNDGWRDADLTMADADNPEEFVQAFWQSANNADWIYFGVDDMNLDKTIRDGVKMPDSGRYQNATDWEFVEIIKNKDLYDKTTFYLDGQPHSLTELIQNPSFQAAFQTGSDPSGFNAFDRFVQLINSKGRGG